MAQRSNFPFFKAVARRQVPRTLPGAGLVFPGWSTNAVNQSASCRPRHDLLVHEGVVSGGGTQRKPPIPKNRSRPPVLRQDRAISSEVAAPILRCRRARRALFGELRHRPHRQSRHARHDGEHRPGLRRGRLRDHDRSDGAGGQLEGLAPESERFAAGSWGV